MARFFDLPPEIRAMIYHLLVQQADLKEIERSDHKKSRRYVVSRSSLTVGYGALIEEYIEG